MSASKYHMTKWVVLVASVNSFEKNSNFSNRGVSLTVL